MFGPQKKKMPDRLICTSCESVFSIPFGGTPVFPKKGKTHYCRIVNDRFIQDDDSNGVRGQLASYPYTPKWCPEQ